MVRKASVIPANPGMAREHQRRHNPIWPDPEQALKRHGACDYSVFLRGNTRQLSGCLEVEDETRFQQIAETDNCWRWWQYRTADLVSESDDSPTAKEHTLRELFRLD